MATGDVRITLDQKGLNIILRSESGAVSKDMMRRGRAVQQKAKVECPVDTGKLRDSIFMRQVMGQEGMSVQIGSDVEYLIYVIKGRGPITAKPGKVLSWIGPGGKRIYAKHVRGVPPNDFLSRSLDAAV